MKKLAAMGAISLSFLMIFGLSACDDPDQPIPHEADVYTRMSVKLDPALSYSEKALLIEDLYKALQFDITAADGSYFSKTFGGSKTANVIDYIDDRINYILPESVELDSRLSYASSTGLNRMLDLPEPNGQKAKEAKIYTVAVNVGTILWFEALTQLPKKVVFSIGDSKVPLESSRIGIVQLGEGYTLKDKDGAYAFPSIIRISTLVHEARHSDCTGGLKASDLAKIANGELPENHACGHLHVRCPVGHPYEGAFACDQLAWGAYSVEALYTLGLMKACKNCTDEEKKAAEVSAVDSLSRVIPLEDMINGKLGDPDMSSSNEVHALTLKKQMLEFRKQRKENYDATSIRLM